MSARMPERVVPSVARGFRVLSDPARLRVLAALVSSPGTRDELADRTGLASSRVGRHLATLSSAEFVVRDPTDPLGRYRLHDPRVAALLNQVCRRLVRECKSQQQLFA